MLKDKITGLSMKVLKVSAQRPESFQTKIGMQTTIIFRCPKFGIRKDKKAARFFYEIEIKPQAEGASFDYIQATFNFVVMLKEETDEAEVVEFVKNTNVSHKVFIPYIDSFISGLSRDMGITPLIFSPSIIKETQEVKQEKI